MSQTAGVFPRLVVVRRRELFSRYGLSLPAIASFLVVVSNLKQAEVISKNSIGVHNGLSDSQLPLIGH